MPARPSLRGISFFVSVLALVVLGVSIRLHLLATADRAAAQWFEQHMTPARTIAAFIVTEFGSDLVAITIIVVIAERIRKRSPYWAKRLLVTVCGGMISNQVLKFVFYRKRPQFFHPLLHLYDNSFPSGHTLTATVLFGTVILLTRALAESRWLRVAVVPFGIGMMLLIAASRIYLGVHYLTDIIGGFLEGIAWISGTGIVLDRTASISGTHPFATNESS